MNKSFPPSVEALRAAIAELPKPVSLQAATLHLALPVTVAPGIAVRISGGTAHYRGTELALSGDIIVDAAELAKLGHRKEDRYLDLSAASSTWVKVIRSGTQKVAFGTDTLLGMPLLTLHPRVPDVAAGELLTYWNSNIPAVELVELPSGVYQTSGNNKSFILTEAIMERRNATKVATTAEDLDAAAAGITKELGGTLRNVEVVASSANYTEADITVKLGANWEAIVPVHVTATSEVVGIGKDDIIPSSNMKLPDGWAWKGTTPAGGYIGQHESTLTTALLVPALLY